MYMTDAYAVTKIWLDMPKDDVCFASMNMEENVEFVISTMKIILLFA